MAWSNLPVWGVLNAFGSDQRTPNIKTILDEIRGRSGWNANNPFTIFVNGTGRRNAHSFEGVPSMAAELVITYTLKKVPVANFPIAKNDIWSYQDSGYNLGSIWKETNYEDSTWKFYLGKFGYGDGNERTNIKFGSNSNNKFITTILEKSL